MAAAARRGMHPRHCAGRLRIQRAALRQYQLSSPGALRPRRNLQVLQPDFASARDIDPEALAQAIRAHLVAFDVDDDREVALALRWQGAPAYDRLAAFAEGIRRGLAARIAARQPIYVMLDGDVAQTLGAILR
jgi:ethanolamine utilization protein EutA